MEELQHCEILKTNINVTNMSDTIKYIGGHLDDLRGKYICVSNVHTTVMSYENEEYRKIQNGAAMALPDGAPLSSYSRRKGYKQAQRVTGPDLMLALFARDNGLKHYFYGSSEETLALLKEKLAEKYPHLQIAGMVSPPFRELSEAEDKEMVDQINASGADIIWVGLGAPKQEKWMYAHKNHVNGVMIGGGAGFDYHAGNIKRAPGRMQKLSLAWLYRLLQDPKRLFKRYLVTNTRYLWLIHRK